MKPEFEPPPKGWSILATIGGVMTAIALVAGIEHLSSHTRQEAFATSTQLASASEATNLAESTLNKIVKRQAAACKFDQSMAPDRGIRFQINTFASKAMAETRSYGVVLPPDYDKNQHTLYPVIVLLHGGHGDAGGWQTCGALTETLYKLYRNGKLPPAIVITPDGNDRRGSSAKWDPQYFDGANGKVATLIGDDLVAEIKLKYRVLDDPRFWALGGVSSGGWGALNIGLRYPDQFHILFSHSGYFTDKSGAENSPQAMIQALPPIQYQPLKVYLEAGSADKEFLNSTEAFHQVLKQLEVDHEFHAFTGGHGLGGLESGWYYWQDHLADSLTYVGSQWIGESLASDPTLVEVANLDAQSTSAFDQPDNAKQLEAMKPERVKDGKPLIAAEIEIARQAWKYFQRNWNDQTGLVNAADGFASVTLWDQAAAIAALVSAREMNFVSASEFETKMSRTLKTLATLPLYKNELPNKVYNAKTLIPVNYGKLNKQDEIGWSALDLGRMALWLKIVGTKYPQFRSRTEAVWQHWQLKRLTKNGQLYGTAIVQGKEQYNQEGRLGYESYAAYGLKLWGLDVKQALNTQAHVGFVTLYGQRVPYDQRDYKTSEANNYVLSEPYILDGIETGFQSLPKAYADGVLAAQEARYQATQQLTALTEDNLDRAPYFVYNTLFVNGQPWATITDTRQQRNDLRFFSAKAAIGWHVLYNTPYTQKLFAFVPANLKSEQGWYNGFYEALKKPNRALTANNNGVILESLLYKQVGQPLTTWAGITP